MILYSTDLLGILSEWDGAPISAIGMQWGTVSFYYILSYYGLVRYGQNLYGGHPDLTHKIMAFCLVFRAKTAYSRYTKGRQLIQQALREVREIVMHYLILVKGGEFNKEWVKGKCRVEDDEGTKPEEMYDINDFCGTIARLHICRMALVAGISLKIFMRLQSDGFQFGELDEDAADGLELERLRLMQLTTADEFAEFAGRYL